MPSLTQGEMFENGLADHEATVDGAGSTTVGVKIADDGEDGPFGLFGEDES